MLKLLLPSDNGIHQIAASVFSELYLKVSGVTVPIITIAEPDCDLVVLGTGEHNIFARQMITENVISRFNICSGSDDYQIKSVIQNNRNLLFIANGHPRSLLYAVYDFFERRCECSWFWDGDIIPQKNTIDISKLDIVEKPRFEYRGIRYFAHRGLHRFQAEHWDFEDWQHEIDWILKKKLNVFMLRTGIDDLFQRAFPDIVPYPETDKLDPDFVDRSYDDRTSFWPLKYRGELREKVLQYAFERGLLHPEDTGTMTHWYSRTPTSFIKKRPVSFLEQSDGFYSQQTGMVWDIKKEQSWEDYWRLTQTHIDHFGQGKLFHTIGLAERSFGKDRKENLKIKKNVYRKIQKILRKSYPTAPLMIASWDFAVFWENDEVKELLNDLNPEHTIILDYAADMDKKTSFEDWGYYKKFPWIFGIFHAFEPETVIHGKYVQLINKITKAADDSFCKGMVFWPEASHVDTFMLEFFSTVAWQPNSIDLNHIVREFCRRRYSNKQMINGMIEVWTKLIDVVANEGWDKDFLCWNKSFQFEPHFRLLNGEMFTGDLRLKHAFLKSNYKQIKIANANSKSIITRLIILAEGNSSNSFQKRDVLDIVRTLLNLKIRENILLLLLTLLESPDDTNGIDACGATLAKQFELLAELLNQHEEFSIFASLEKLQTKRSINPYSEQTLKSNIENSYSRSQAYELAAYVYRQEFEVFLNGVKACAQERTSRLPETIFKQAYDKIQDKFYDTPLRKMQSDTQRNILVLPKILCKIVLSFDSREQNR